MESIKQGANYVAETAQQAVSGTSKEANKEVAKDSNASLTDRFVHLNCFSCTMLTIQPVPPPQRTPLVTRPTRASTTPRLRATSSRCKECFQA